jgi:hypothetical protein
MPLCHYPVVTVVLGHWAPCVLCLDSRGWISQLDSGDCALCADGMGCIERSGAGNVPITPSTWTLMALCTWHTACVNALRPALSTVILGEWNGLCLAHPVCSLQGVGLLPHPCDLLCLLVCYMHGSINLGLC